MAVAKTVKEQLGVELPDPEPLEPEVTEPEAPEVERPAWLPEKYKDAEAFVEGYHNLEEELRQRGESQNEMQAQLDQLSSMIDQQQSYQQTQQTSQQDPNAYAEQLMNAYEADPHGTIVFLSQQAAADAIQQYQLQTQPQTQQQQEMAGDLMAQSAERVLEARHTDWNEYAAKVGDVLELNPGLLTQESLTSVDRTVNVLEAIYKQVKYDDLATQLEAANGDQTRMKQQAQSVSGGAGRPGTISENEETINRIIAAAKASSYSAWRGGSGG